MVFEQQLERGKAGLKVVELVVNEEVGLQSLHERLRHAEGLFEVDQVRLTCPTAGGLGILLLVFLGQITLIEFTLLLHHGPRLDGLRAGLLPLYSLLLLFLDGQPQEWRHNFVDALLIGYALVFAVESHQLLHRLLVLLPDES